MSKRRPHTKSRGGCNRCKRRRIKCDEAGPPCATCRARDAECEYSLDIFRPSSWVQSSENPGAEYKAQSVLQTPHRESCEDVQDGPSLPPTSLTRNRELQLMHHWTLKTCHSFSATLSQVFQTYVVKEALHYPFLMDSLLALTALHMASELSDTVEKKELLNDALQYQSRAMPVFRDELGNVSPANCHALFACSVMMMACTVVFPSLEASRDERENRAKAPTGLKSLFHLISGIHSIIDQARESLEEGPFKVIIQPWSGADPAFLSPEERVLPSELRRLGDYALSSSLYRNAIDTLEHFAMAEGMVIPWIKVVGEEFIELVEDGEPLALLIYACWARLMALQEMWWAQSAGKMIIQDFGHVESGEERDCLLKSAPFLYEMLSST